MIEIVMIKLFGWATWILSLIPLVLLVRLLVRRSRWSVWRVTLISLVGTAVASAWLYFTEHTVDAEPLSLGGMMGQRIGVWLVGKTASLPLSYSVTTAAFFLWILAAWMDAIIATARFFINKPYIREVVKEVEPPKPVTEPRRKTAAKPKPSKTKGSSSVNEPRKEISSLDEAPDYEIPAPSILMDGSSDHHEVTRSEIERNISVIRETLADHHIQVEDIKAVPGPTVTLYKIYPAKGVRVAAIQNLADDVAVALKSGKLISSLLDDCVGMEVANIQRSIVSMKELVESREFKESRASLPVAIGRKVTGEVRVFDLADAPHLLVAGATGQGKSVGLNVLVASLLYAKRPSELKFVFIDPKKTEFSRYSRLYSHYLAVLPDAESAEDERTRSIVKLPKAADAVLRSLCQEMSDRYDLLEKARTPEIGEYNHLFSTRKINPKNGHRYLPYLVVIIDEYAQLVLGTGGSDSKAHSRSIMTSIISLAQMGRACGIHLVIATQTPRREVISGLIKANFPMSIAFTVKTDVDSRVILDQTGAEKLIGKGDMLLSKNATTERIQSGYIRSSEIDSLTKAVEGQEGYRKSFSTPYYLPEVSDEGADNGSGQVDMKRLDERFEEAARLVVMNQNASTSYLQTTLGMGFAKSARVMSQLEAAGIVGPANGAKKREVLIESLAELEPIIQSFTKR
ncbi:MAG: DNA translocase FtsK [Bacteroidales bacterium]|nr:DNA translocase FtsK [Bacteroidales bacterium]